MSSPITHLMWKEYRTLRGLWVSMLGIGTLLFLAAMAFATHVTWIDVVGCAGFATVVTFGFFIPAGLALAFTLETEERTLLLLQQFAPTWRQLMIGKLVPLMLATLAIVPAMLLTTGAGTAVIWMIRPHAFTEVTMHRAASVNALGLTELASAIVCFSALLIVPALFWATTFKRVITTVWVSFITILILYPATIISQFHLGFPVTAWLWIFACLPAGFSSVRWYQGRRWELLRLPQKPVNMETAASREAVPQRERLMSLRRWLTHIVRQQHSWLRMSSMLLWKEFRTGWPLLLVGITAPVIVILCTQASNPRFRGFCVLLVTAAICQECGLRTFRREHSDGTLLFGAHRGISPQLTWLVKTSFWFFVAFLSLNLVLALRGCLPVSSVDTLTLQIHRSGRVEFLGSAVFDFLTQNMAAHSPEKGIGHQFPGNSYFIPLTLGMGCTVSGLIASAWVRQTVLSFAFATGVSAALFLVVLPACFRFNLPLPALTLPVLLAWTATSLLTVRQSVELRHSWRLDGARIAVLTLAVIMAVVVGYRLHAQQVAPATQGIDVAEFGVRITQ